MKKKLPNKSPSISRFFTEEMLWLWIGIGMVLIAIVVSGKDLYQSLVQKNSYQKERKSIVLETGFWQDIVQKYPDYRDAYFNLAVLEYKFGNKEKAREYLEKVFELDPNSEEGKKLEQLIK